MTPLAVLVERVRETGYQPWLFHRDGWDWCWRSWGRVADHVARSAEALSGLAEDPRRVGYGARQHPDAVTAGLAIQAAGMIAVPVRGGPQAAASLGCSVWAEVGEGGEKQPEAGLERVALPPVLSPLDRTPPRSLDLEKVPATGAVAGAEQEVISPEVLMSAARRFDRRLPASGRPRRRREGARIVCAAPDLDPRAALLLEAWSLVRGAAWVLEPQASAFIETVLWARPTMVWARVPELEMLAARMRDRKHRRRSRLSAVVAAGEAVDPGPWNALGIEVIEVVPLPPSCRTAV